MDLVSMMILALLAAALLIALVLIVISGRRRARSLEQALAEGEQIRGTVAALQAEVSELKQGAVAPEPMAREFVPARAITPDQRAEALEMLGRGADSAAVSSSTGLSQAEVELLQKIQNLRQSDSAPPRPKTR